MKSELIEQALKELEKTQFDEFITCFQCKEPSKIVYRVLLNRYPRPPMLCSSCTALAKTNDEIKRIHNRIIVI